MPCCTSCSSVPCCCATSTPEFPTTVNIVTNNEIINLADTPAQYRDEVIEVAADVATLTYLPINDASTYIFVNGQLVEDPDVWNRNAKIITFESGILPDNREVRAKYITRETVPTETFGDVGMMMSFATTVIPNGWIECDGQLVSQTAYATLFGVLGHIYLNVPLDTDEATLNAMVPPMFRLPNLENEVFDGVATVTKPLIIKY